MFQYAVGKVLSLKNNTELKLDISAFDTYRLHEYSLEKLSIQRNYIAKKDLPWYENSSSNKYIDFIFQKIKNLVTPYNKYHFRENGFELFNENVLTLPDGTYLDGYFQSDKYFREYSDIIRNDFEVSIPPSQENILMIEKIQSVNPVSLHIRRGDYVKNSNTQALHGLCNAEYYQKSIAYIAERVENPVFFVFSDDIAWAKENMKTGFEQYFIDFNDASQNHEDIRLMKHCKHHIIANSTFSWWGAWLNPSSEKIVTMPSIWFSGYTYDTRDLYPDGWVRI
jgi:hypothetical protein